MYHSVLLISFKLLGDIIVQTPAIKSIKTHNPRCKISVLLEDKFADVLAGNNDVDTIISYPYSHYKKSNLLKKIILFFRLIRTLRAYKFDAVVLMDKTSLGCLISFFCGAKVRIGLAQQSCAFLLNKKINLKEGSMDYITFYNKIACGLASLPLTRKTQLCVNSQAINAARVTLAEYNFTQKEIISIHLGASREDKMWPSEKYRVFIHELLHTRNDVEIILMCGPGEKKWIEKVFSELDASVKSRVFNAGELYIKELVAYFSLSSLIVCHDSASRHVAMAIGKKTLVLMNQWNLGNWQLYSPKEGQTILTPAEENKCSYNIKDIDPSHVCHAALQLLFSTQE